MRKFQAIGLALFAALAMSAVGVASATAHEFHSEAATTVLDTVATVSGNPPKSQVFKTGTGEVNCNKVTTESKITGVTVTQITIAPKYEECTAVVGGSTLTAKVEFTSCDYLFTGATNASGHSDAHVQCVTAGDEIHVKVFILGAFRPCYTIPAQTPTGGGVRYINQGVGTTRDIELEATVTGITYTKEGVCGSDSVNDATYTGQVTVKGTDASENHVGIWYGT